MRMDRRTDIHDKGNSRFSQFWERLETTETKTIQAQHKL
jgi:hypothetical protein